MLKCRRRRAARESSSKWSLSHSLTSAPHEFVYTGASKSGAVTTRFVIVYILFFLFIVFFFKHLYQAALEFYSRGDKISFVIELHFFFFGKN